MWTPEPLMGLGTFLLSIFIILTVALGIIEYKENQKNIICPDHVQIIIVVPHFNYINIIPL